MEHLPDANYLRILASISSQILGLLPDSWKVLAINLTNPFISQFEVEGVAKPKVRVAYVVFDFLAYRGVPLLSVISTRDDRCSNDFWLLGKAAY